MADSWEDHAFESDEDVKEELPKDEDIKDEKENEDLVKGNLAKDDELMSSDNVHSVVGLRESIDDFEPTNWDEMIKFKELLRHKVTQFDSSQHYVGFLEEMVKTLCKDVDLDSLKKISDAVAAMSNEKAKQSKNAKSKKKNKKANLTSGKDVDVFEQYIVADTAYDEFEDFM